jgi:hypothetical protein
LRPTRKIALSIAALVVAFAAWWLWWPHEARTAKVLLDQYGQTTSGAEFDVAIGGAWRDADRVLRARFRPKYVLVVTGPEQEVARGGGVSGRAPTLRGFEKVSYRDGSWRNGLITLELQDGVVRRVIWHYPGPLFIGS